MSDWAVAAQNLVRRKRAWAVAGAITAAVPIIMGMALWGEGAGSLVQGLAPGSLGCLVCCLVARTMWTWERTTVNRLRVVKLARLLGYFFALAQIASAFLMVVVAHWERPLWTTLMAIVLALATGFTTLMAVSRTWPPQQPSRPPQELPRYEQPPWAGWSGPVSAHHPEQQDLR
ncbi:MAG: hypothetical protein Q4G45_00585 [Actinomycetia bacterium]|nr:hypothetical protein [Actinomycetes bacterium]